MLQWVRCAVALLLPACFHPNYDHPACGPHRECPSGFTCSADLVCESGSIANLPDAGSALPDGMVVDLSPICPSIERGDPVFNAASCATPTMPLAHITADTSFDTDQGTSTTNGLNCARVRNNGDPTGNSDICVLAASSIMIDPGVVLSAHGSIPFGLFARSITIQGTIDVASHIGGPPGAGSLLSGCIPGKLATGGGGGRGGDGADYGGRGGDDGSTAMTGASGGGTLSFNGISGGCGGTRGGDGTATAGSDGGNTTGGAGGGAVWIVSLSSDLIIGSSPPIIGVRATINASGASGIGGKQEGAGGAGGGSGGLIVLQAPNIRVGFATAIFANGGHGGGGAGGGLGFHVGFDGSDPTEPLSGGAAGGGGLNGGESGSGGTTDGAGGGGFPDDRVGTGGLNAGHGGGGGGGGPGAIRVVSVTTTVEDINGWNVSPPPVLLR